jgi:hypothetical protein
MIKMKHTDLMEILKKGTKTEEFTILENLNLEHLNDNDNRFSAACKHAEEKYKGFSVHLNSAHLDRKNGLTVAVVGDKKYLVYQPGTERPHLIGEYFGTLGWKMISGRINGVPMKERINCHIHLYKSLSSLKD